MEDSQKYLPPTVNDYHHEEDMQNNTLPSFRDFYEKFKDEYHTKEKVHVSNKHLSGRDFRGKYLTVFFVTSIQNRQFTTISCMIATAIGKMDIKIILLRLKL